MAISDITNLSSLTLSDNLIVGGTITLTGGQSITGSLVVSAGLSVGSILNITTLLTVGDSNTGTNNPGIFLNRTISTATANYRGYRDQSTFSSEAATARAYAAFDAEPVTSGSNALDHIVGFQGRPDHNATGSIAQLAGFSAVIGGSGGAINEAWSFKAYAFDGSASVTTLYGLQVQDTTTGTTAYGAKLELTEGSNRYNLHTGNAASYFGGIITVGGTAVTTAPNAYLRLRGSLLSTNTTQVGFYSSFTSSTGATASSVGFRADVDLADGSYTCANAIGFLLNSMTKGGSATVTRATGFFALNPTIGGTGNAAIADNLTYSGDYFIHSTSTNPSILGGGLSIGSACTITGNLGVGAKIFNGGSAGSSAMLKLNGNTNTGTTQINIDASTFTATSAATAGAYGILSGATSANASFTLPVLANFYSQNITKGASSTVTRRFGLLVDAPTGAATANVAIGDSTSVTGDYSLYLANANPALIGGAVTMGVASTSVHTLNAATATTIGSAGTATAIPTPVGYLRININGTERKIPYCNT